MPGFFGRSSDIAKWHENIPHSSESKNGSNNNSKNDNNNMNENKDPSVQDQKRMRESFRIPMTKDVVDSWFDELSTMLDHRRKAFVLTHFGYFHSLERMEQDFLQYPIFKFFDQEEGIQMKDLKLSDVLVESVTSHLLTQFYMLRDRVKETVIGVHNRVKEFAFPPTTHHNTILIILENYFIKDYNIVINNLVKKKVRETLHAKVRSIWTGDNEREVDETKVIHDPDFVVLTPTGLRDVMNQVVKQVFEGGLERLFPFPTSHPHDKGGINVLLRHIEWYYKFAQ